MELVTAIIQFNRKQRFECFAVAYDKIDMPAPQLGRLVFLIFWFVGYLYQIAKAHFWIDAILAANLLQ
jgi:hypothetical protein